MRGHSEDASEGCVDIKHMDAEEGQGHEATFTRGCEKDNIKDIESTLLSTLPKTKIHTRK